MDRLLNKDDMDEAASSFALETKETGFFNMQQEIPGIGWSYEFAKKAFELKKDEISNVLIKTGKAFYIIQVKEKKDPYIPEFKDTRGSVIDAFVKNKSIELAGKEAKKTYLRITNKMKKGKRFKNALDEMKLQPLKTDFVNRDGYIPTLGPAKDFVEASLSVKDGGISSPIKMLDNWVILKLDEYQGMDETKFLEEKEDFGKETVSQKRQAKFDKWFLELKIRANFVSYTLE